jgi:hydroxylysine kinase
MNTQNPLDVVATSPPSFTVDEAVGIAAERYGLEVTARVLVSERDQNFRLAANDGKRYVLKIANSAEDPVVTDFQIRALLHIQDRADALLATPTVLKTLDGEYSLLLESRGRKHVVRIVSFVAGTPLGDDTPGPLCARNMGAYLARLGRVLDDFSHPGADQSLLWDMKQASSLRTILHHIDDPLLRELATKTLDDFESNALPVFDSLRSQVIHNDMNPDNVLLTEPGGSEIAGVIDFGDMLRSPLIVDVAVAAAYLRSMTGNPLTLIVEFIAGYHSEMPLLRAEIDILHDLIKTRLMTTVCIFAWRESLRGSEDAYLRAYAEGESTAGLFLQTMSEIPRDNAAKIYSEVCASTTLRS